MTKFLIMQTVSLATAKAHLSTLINQVETGEEILITRHGKIAAKIVCVPQSRNIISGDEIRAFHRKIPSLKTPSASIIRKMRDEGY